VEAVAGGHFLQKLLLPQLADDQALVPSILPYDQELPETADTVLLFCTSGCFTQTHFIRTIVGAAARKLKILPVIAEDSFRVPGKDVRKQLHAALPAGLEMGGYSTEDVAAIIWDVFKQIAVSFTPNASSDMVLQLRSREIASRVRGHSVSRVLTLYEGLYSL